MSSLLYSTCVDFSKFSPSPLKIPDSLVLSSLYIDFITRAFVFSSPGKKSYLISEIKQFHTHTCMHLHAHACEHTHSRTYTGMHTNKDKIHLAQLTLLELSYTTSHWTVLLCFYVVSCFAVDYI